MQDSYERVLRYMEATGEQDYTKAQNELSLHNFDVSEAVSARLQRHHGAGLNLPEQNPNEAVQNDQEVVVRYIQHLRLNQQQWSLFSLVGSYLFSAVKWMFTATAETILPEFMLNRMLRSNFYRLYRPQIKFSYREKQLIELLKLTKQNSSMIVLVAISGNHSDQVLMDLLLRNQITQEVGRKILFLGLLSDSEQLQVLPASHDPPQVLALRMNIFEEVIVLQRWEGPQNIRSIDASSLKKIYEQSRNLFKRDCNVMVKYRNYVRRYYGDVQLEEEEDQINLVDRQYEIKEVQRQNQEFQRAQLKASEFKRNQQEESQREEEKSRMMEELIEERRARKSSIPDEPGSGEVVRISFRCPDGSTKLRSFLKEDKVDLIYQWVELNEEIEFEDNSKRQFRIMHSYPPQPLCALRQKLLADVFESDQQKVLINEM